MYTLFSISSSNAAARSAGPLPTMLRLNLEAAIRNGQPAMARWSEPGNLICPGDPSAAWYVVNSNGLLFAFTADQLSLQDVISFGNSSIVCFPNWQQVVGYYTHYYNANLHEHEVHAAGPPPGLSRALGARASGAAQVAANDEVSRPSSPSSVNSGLSYVDPPPRTAPASTNVNTALVPGDRDTSPRPLASPAPLGPAFTQSASHTTQYHDRSRPSSPFLAFSPDAIARIAPPSWELTMDSVIAPDGRPSERSHLRDSGERRDSLEDAARRRPQESGERRDSSEDVERRRPRGSDGSQSSSEDVEMADVEGEDDADRSPIIRVNKGKKKLNPKPYRVIKKVKLNSSAATKVIRWINRPRPRIVLHDFDSSQGGDDDDDDEDEDEDEDDEDDGSVGDDHCGQKHKRRDDDHDDDDGNVGEGSVEEDDDSDYETAEESFEEKSVRDTLAAGESPVRSSSQITHISATPSPPPSSCTRIFRPLFSDSDLGQTSSQRARATPPFRYLNSAVESSSDLNLHIEFPPTPPSSNAAEPASSQRSTPASPTSSDLLQWEEYTDEQHALIGNLLDEAHEKHVKDLKLD